MANPNLLKLVFVFTNLIIFFVIQSVICLLMSPAVLMNFNSKLFLNDDLWISVYLNKVLKIDIESSFPLLKQSFFKKYKSIYTKHTQAGAIIETYSPMRKKARELKYRENCDEYSLLKKRLTEVLIGEITPVGKEIQKLLDDKVHLKGILKKGGEKANIIAEKNLKNIRDIVGLI